MPRRSFQAMGGETEIVVAGGEGRERAAAADIAAQFEEYEGRLSRFLPWSELSQLNATAGSGERFAASGVLFDAVQAALGWAERTGGVFDPTVLDSLESWGYDRQFDAMGEGVPAGPVDAGAKSDWRKIEVDADLRTIRLPANTRIDLGGIGKGFTVDRAVGAVDTARVLVNASGDMYAKGDGPDGDGWIIGVQDARRRSRDRYVLRVSDRGVATSGCTKRAWMRGERRYHHLVDTRAMLPAETGVLTCTVVAEDATTADVLAKAVLLLGPERGIALADEFGAACLLVTASGDVTNERWKEYLA